MPTSPTGNKEDFSTRVRTKSGLWMQQWAAADLPRVRNIVREVLTE
jgi:hypothetical protein